MSEPIVPLKAALGDLVTWFRNSGVEGLIIGGVAASLLGRPRTTRDIDAVVWLEETEWKGFLRDGERQGFETRINDALAFARQAWVLLVRHASSGIDVDVAFGALPFEKEAIEHGRVHDVDGLLLPLPRPEDLIVMKAVAHRPRDAGDIEGVLDAHPDLDRAYVQRLVREFAVALEQPELLADLESLLKQTGE